MKRILLIYAVSHRIQNPLGGVAPPSGLSWVAKALHVNNFDSRICDLSLAKDKADIEFLLKTYIDEYSPHAIGISIRNIDTSVNPPRTFFPFLEQIAVIIKNETNVPIILGGPGFSLYSKKCMKKMGGDYGIIGEGEYSFPKLLKNVLSGHINPNIPGLVMNKNGTVLQIKNKIFGGYSTFGKAMHKGIDYDAYEKIGGCYPIQTKRGCSFKCIYCDYPYLEGRKYRMRSPEVIVDEIEELNKLHDLRHFFFTDSVFNYPHDFCIKILKEIIRRNLDIRWTAYVNPCELTGHLVELFKTSGCSRLEVTIDSAEKETLRSYQKHFSEKEIKKADAYFHQFHIPTYYWVNLGGPGENGDTLKKNFVNLHNLKQVTKGWLGIGFVVLPGSPLYKIAVDEGRIKNDGLEEPYLYLSDRLPEDYAQQVQLFCIDHPEWFSVYDMLDEDYRKMAMQIINEKVRNHWQMQNEYGMKRRKKYRRGELPILSHEDYLGMLEIRKKSKVN